MVKKEWYVHHTNCPKCGSGNVKKTNKEVPCANEMEYVDDINTASCPECGWKGMVKNLVIDPALNSSVKEMQAKLRTIDKVNEECGKDDVYISAEDMVAAIRGFGNQLTAALQDEDTITYTQNLLAEIIKMIISADISHRVKREQAMNNAEETKEENKE